ncbi:MAG: type II toxin-antitoxin system prevent-host-death family antitoxin [Verrucomicrobiota bacterium]
METTLTVTEAARNFADVVNRAYYRHEATTLLKNGKPVARVVPAAAVAKTGKEIAARMAVRRPRLTAREAEAFEVDLREARAAMPAPIAKWD